MATHHDELIEVLRASMDWIAHFNAGEVEACVDTYLPNAVMNAAPMGRFEGREAIAGFWKPFVESGAGELVYTEVTLELLGPGRVRMAANWSMNVGRGVITNELWLRDEDGAWRLAEDDFEVLEQFAAGERASA